MSQLEQRRFVVCLALTFYSSSILVLALHPLSSLTWAEDITALLAAVSIVGLIGHGLPWVKIPHEELAYLVTGWSGFTTMLLYLIHTHDGSAQRTVTVLFLLSGVIGGYGAYLAQEGEGGV